MRKPSRRKFITSVGALAGASLLQDARVEKAGDEFFFRSRGKGSGQPAGNRTVRRLPTNQSNRVDGRDQVRIACWLAGGAKAALASQDAVIAGGSLIRTTLPNALQNGLRVNPWTPPLPPDALAD